MKSKFKKGLNVLIIGNTSSHGFEIDTEVIISRVLNRGQADEYYRCRLTREPYSDWLVKSSDIELVDKPKENFIPVKRRRGRRH